MIDKDIKVNINIDNNGYYQYNAIHNNNIWSNAIKKVIRNMIISYTYEYRKWWIVLNNKVNNIINTANR